MSAEVLDIRQHAPEDFPGKLISLNGADYVLGELVGEGGEALVYPMRNTRSGISWFAAKVYKFLEGSVEYQARTKHAGIDFSSFLLDLEGLPAAYTEVHQIRGGLMRLQRNMAGTSDPQYYDGLMKEAGNLAKAQRWEEAATAYRDVLGRNGAHTPAMINLSTCLLNQQRFREALSVLSVALDIEPNDRDIYRQMALALFQVGAADEAIHILDRTLNRYVWDAEAWKLKIRIATTHGRCDALQHLIKVLQPIAEERGERYTPLAQSIDAGLESAQETADQLGAASACQMKGDWKGAVGLWEGAGAETWTLLDHLNAAICYFQIGHFQEAVRHSTHVAGCNLSGVDTACGLMILATKELADWEHCVQAATYLERMAKEPFDLPSVPNCVMPGGAAMEERSGQPYIEALSALLDNIEPARQVAVQRLLARYKAREKAIQAG